MRYERLHYSSSSNFDVSHDIERDLKEHHNVGGADDTEQEARERHQVALLRTQLLERASLARKMKVTHQMDSINPSRYEWCVCVCVCVCVSIMTE
jgi:hypoxanthine-guanine phosphoribosyltransferase